MAVPKKRTTKSNSRARRNFYRIKKVQVNSCSRCGAHKVSHNICEVCGFYRDIKISKLQKELLK